MALSLAWLSTYAYADIHSSCATKPTLFCCNLSASSAQMYAGPAYVYFAQADDPEAALLAEASISAARRDHGSAARAIFASVVGGLTGLNYLSRLQNVHSAVLFDINPWMVEYAAFIVELVRIAPSRSDWLGRLFSRNASGFFDAQRTTRFTNALEDEFYGRPVEAAIAASTAQKLSSPSRCVFRWFTEHVAPDPLPKSPPVPRRVCERLRLSEQPRSDWSEKLDVGLVVNGRCMGSPPSKCKRIMNTCKVGIGHGWLESPESYTRARSVLLGRVEFRAWAAGQPLDQLFASIIPPPADAASAALDLIMYTSNVETFVGASKWPGIVDGWRHAMRCSSILAKAKGLYYASYFSPRNSPYSAKHLPPVTVAEKRACADGNQTANAQRNQDEGTDAALVPSSGKSVVTRRPGPPERCPLQRCSGAHKCAWQALSHHLLTNRTHRLVEVTKEGKFVEFQQNLKADYATVQVQDFLSGKSLPDIWTHRPTPSVLFHIIVGEGGSRWSLRQAVKLAAKAHAREIWVMDHNFDAPSWKDRSKWPASNGRTIIGTAGARDKDSELWTHSDLLAMLEETIMFSCPRPSLVADCGIAATHGASVHDQRNMLIGFRCAHSHLR